MTRVALDLGRSALVAFDEDRVAPAGSRDAGGVIKRHAGDDVLRRARIGQHPHVRPTATAYARQSHEGKRGAHELKETAAINRRPFRLAFKDVLEAGKLAMVLVHRWHP